MTWIVKTITFRSEKGAQTMRDANASEFVAKMPAKYWLTIARNSGNYPKVIAFSSVKHIERNICGTYAIIYNLFEQETLVCIQMLRMRATNSNDGQIIKLRATQRHWNEVRRNRGKRQHTTIHANISPWLKCMCYGATMIALSIFSCITCGLARLCNTLPLTAVFIKSAPISRSSNTLANITFGIVFLLFPFPHTITISPFHARRILQLQTVTNEISPMIHVVAARFNGNLYSVARSFVAVLVWHRLRAPPMYVTCCLCGEYYIFHWTITTPHFYTPFYSRQFNEKERHKWTVLFENMKMWRLQLWPYSVCISLPFHRS